MIALEELVPTCSPHHLDHIPTRAVEDAFEFVDDALVAANRTVEPLQVAVHHEDEVVQLSRAATVSAPSESTSSVSPSPTNAHTLRGVFSISLRFSR